MNDSFTTHLIATQDMFYIPLYLTTFLITNYCSFYIYLTGKTFCWWGIRARVPTWLQEGTGGGHKCVSAWGLKACKLADSSAAEAGRVSCTLANIRGQRAAGKLV